MSEEDKDLGIFGLAITLLAGISAVLLKLIAYFNNNIISATTSIMIHILVTFLLLEALIILLFFLTKGYLVSTRENMPENLVKISYLLQKAIFLWPFTTIVYFFLSFSYILTTNNLRIPDWINTLLIGIFAILSGILFICLLLREYPLKKWINEKIEKIRLWLKDKKFTLKACSVVFKTVSVSLAVVFVALLIALILYFVLSLTSVFLLCGSYSTEINHFPDSNTEIMSFTIKDTGIPSGKCNIHLYRVNDSNDNLFKKIDNITLQESEKSSSKNMTGKKKDGIYYLFINTSNLPPDNYFLTAQGASQVRDFGFLFICKKCDGKLFYLPPKNKTVTALNQTSIL